jgi:transposase
LIYRRRSQIAIIDEHGEIKQQRIATGRQTFTDALGDPDDTHVALEATYGWEWLADQLTSAGFDVHLAHPLRTRAIAAARVKTDAVDARTLAHLLRTGLLPEAWIAPAELRDLRDLLRHRHALVGLRTSTRWPRASSTRTGPRDQGSRTLDQTHPTERLVDLVR